MPAFLIASATETTLCDVNGAGYPDRKTGVPVKAQFNADSKSVVIDAEPYARAIHSCVGQDGTTTYLIDGSTRQLINRERRVTLDRASTLLTQLRDCLLPLTAASKEPDYVVESLQTLFDWIREERQRLTEG